MGAIESAALYQSSLRSLPLLGRGKVRDNYAVGEDQLLIVTSDRLSAFDVVMSEPIPDKGKVLNQMSQFWFEKLADVVPNHLTGVDPQSVVSADEHAQVSGRSMVVKRLQPILVEAVVRGYVIGSGWKDYRATGEVCGIPLPPGLQMADRLPQIIFTPSTKAAVGDHDENVDFSVIAGSGGRDMAERVKDVSIEIFRTAGEHALERRDRHCRFPGCDLRYCEAHHIHHWGAGGETRLENLALLCRVHHRAVHEGGFRAEVRPDGELVF